MPRIAILREVSRSLERCELTHRERQSIDVERARAQHRAYAATLASLGCSVEWLEELPHHPDAVFVEDVAVVFDEVAVLTRPGAVSRRGEVEAIAPALARHRSCARIRAPATLDGGDVLRLGRRVFVGLTARTNRGGVEQLAARLEPWGYSVTAVPVAGCLHLKTAVTALDDETLLVQDAWIDREAFGPLGFVATDAEEPMAANALRVGGAVVYPAAFPRTAERLRRAGFEPVLVEADELAKAEGGVTCCSLLLEGSGAEGGGTG